MIRCHVAVLRFRAKIHVIRCTQILTAARLFCTSDSSVLVCPMLGRTDRVVLRWLKSFLFRLWYHADLLSVFTRDCVIFSSELKPFCFVVRHLRFMWSCNAARPCNRPYLCRRIELCLLSVQFVRYDILPHLGCAVYTTKLVCLTMYTDKSSKLIIMQFCCVRYFNWFLQSYYAKLLFSLKINNLKMCILQYMLIIKTQYTFNNTVRHRVIYYTQYSAKYTNFAFNKWVTLVWETSS